MSSETFETIFHKVFIEWANYTSDERKAHKEILKMLCPHKHIEKDYVETDAEGNGQPISYCVVCKTTFTCQ